MKRMMEANYLDRRGIREAVEENARIKYNDKRGRGISERTSEKSVTIS